MSRGGERAGSWAAGFVVLGLLVAGCGGGSDESSTAETTTTEASTAETTTTSPPAESQGGSSASVDLYFTSGEQFHKVKRALPRGPELVAATEALVAGPTKSERRAEVPAQTQIPDGVAVEDVTLADDGTAVVRLSPKFISGVPAEASRRTDAEQQALSGRLGQLTYTLTQFDGVRSVKVLAGGVPVEQVVERHDFAKPAQGPEPVTKPRGEKIPGTREIQRRLAQLRFLPKGAVDGVDGYRTQQAVIAFQSWNGLDRDGVVGPATTAALNAANRPKPRGQGPSRRIEVYRDQGVALLIEHGQTKRAIHVSSGGPATPTPAGTYRVFRKELRSWSVPFQVWLPYASYFNAGIAFHEYPDVPTYPASHGCVRVPAPEAKGLYRFASLDTVVVVL